MEVRTIWEFKQNINPCRHVKIYRQKLDYHHHVFIGWVDHFGCDIFHYKVQWEEYFYGHPPGRITSERLIFDETNQEGANIFDFEKCTVTIVARNDYPQTPDEMQHAIKRAESRLGEAKYSASFNNCESYVNWIFSGDNASQEFKNGGLRKRMLAGAVDASTSDGILRPVKHGASSVASEGVTTGSYSFRTRSRPEGINVPNRMLRSSSNIRSEQYLSYKQVIKEHGDKLENMLLMLRNRALRDNGATQMFFKSAKSSTTNSVSKQTVSKLTKSVIKPASDCTKTSFAAPSIAKSASKSISNKVANSAAPSVVKSASKSISNDVTKSASKTILNEVAKSTASSVAKSASKSISNQVAKSAAPSVAKSASKSISNGVVKSASKSISNGVVKSAASSVAKSASKSISNEAAKSASKSISHEAAKSGVPSVAKSASKSISNNVAKSSVSQPARKAIAKTMQKSIKSCKQPSMAKSAGRAAENATENAGKLSSGITKGAVATAVVFEGVFLAKKLYDIVTDEDMDDEEKGRSATMEISSSVVGVPAGLCGAAVGQVLIPVPFLGAAVGGIVGGMIGNAVGGAVGEGMFSIFN